MTTTQIAKRLVFTERPIVALSAHDVSHIERDAPMIPSTRTSNETTIEVSDADINTSSPTSVWDWAHLRYADDELDEFDKMLDEPFTAKPRW